MLMIKIIVGAVEPYYNTISDTIIRVLFSQMSHLPFSQELREFFQYTQLGTAY